MTLQSAIKPTICFLLVAFNMAFTTTHLHLILPSLARDFTTAKIKMCPKVFLTTHHQHFSITS